MARFGRPGLPACANRLLLPANRTVSGSVAGAVLGGADRPGLHPSGFVRPLRFNECHAILGRLANGLGSSPPAKAPSPRNFTRIRLEILGGFIELTPSRILRECVR
jgi:hypothetical protein